MGQELVDGALLLESVYATSSRKIRVSRANSNTNTSFR